MNTWTDVLGRTKVMSRDESASYAITKSPAASRAHDGTMFHLSANLLEC